jgi:hypothetical protein
MTRYFYNNSGEIIGFCHYSQQCLTISIQDSVGYLDHDQEIEIENYQVDLTTQTLIPRNQ